jgi:hypothetical protein
MGSRVGEIGRVSGKMVDMTRDKWNCTRMDGGHHRSGIIHWWRSGLKVDGTSCGDLVRDPLRIDSNAGRQVWWVLVRSGIGLGLRCNWSEGRSDRMEDGRC